MRFCMISEGYAAPSPSPSPIPSPYADTGETGAWVAAAAVSCLHV